MIMRKHVNLEIKLMDKLNGVLTKENQYGMCGTDRTRIQWTDWRKIL